MTDEQQRIAIAKACGWSRCYLQQQADLHDDARGLPPDALPTAENYCYLPDYCNDLNAMHEAEKVAGISNTELSIPYKEWLDRLSCPHFATARQRAEAFLRTLNLWTK
jgi:hypothetical protein